MRVAIAGAHGKIARQLTERLVAGGDTVIALIRNPAHADELRAPGVEPVTCDLENAGVDDVTEAIRGADAAVFAAGAGPGSGAARKMTMDRDGAVKLVQASSAAGVPRFVIISSVGAESPPDDDDVFSVYLRAKAQADEAVAGSDRDWTIVRPGALTDDPGTGRARIESTPFRGRVAREDVAAVLAALLFDPRATGHTLYVNGGDDPIADALTAALG
jgi:nucleoside-diphosphate-sugar epimerase